MLFSPMNHRSIGNGVRTNCIRNHVHIDDVASILKFRMGFSFETKSALAGQSRLVSDLCLPVSIVNCRLGIVNMGLIAATLFVGLPHIKQKIGVKNDWVQKLERNADNFGCEFFERPEALEKQGRKTCGKDLLEKFAENNFSRIHRTKFKSSPRICSAEPRDQCLPTQFPILRYQALF